MLIGFWKSDAVLSWEKLIKKFCGALTRHMLSCVAAMIIIIPFLKNSVLKDISLIL